MGYLNRKVLLQNIFLVVVLVQLSSLLIMATSGKKLVWDEAYYLKTVPLVWNLGLSKQFFMQLPGPPGPLFSWVHALFAPITSLSLPQVRILNFCFLLITMGGISLSLLVRKCQNSYFPALCIMGLPPIYVISGLVLTDILPLSFFSIGLALMTISLMNNRLRGWVTAILSGILFSAACLGRQTYLIPVIMLALYAVLEHKLANKLFLILLLGIMPFVFVAFIWKGLTPPKTSLVSYGLNIRHLFLSFFYIGILATILSPRWIRINWIWACISLTIGISINMLCHLIYVAPMYTLAVQLLSTSHLSLYTAVVSNLALGFSLLIFLVFSIRAWEHRTDKFYLYLTAVILMTAISTIKITHLFHSKYILGAIPCLILVMASYIKITKWLILRMLLGGILGLAILYSYLFLYPLR